MVRPSEIARVRAALRIARKLLVLTLSVAAVVAASAAPAGAHAVLESTDPVAGAVLDASPRAVELDFSEPITVALGGVRIFDVNGDRVGTGKPEKPAADRIRIPIGARLADGAYVVTWRVTSADTHPIQGAFTFQVGAASNATGREIGALADRLLADQGGSRPVSILWGLVRWLAYVGIALLVGGVCFGVIVWSRAGDMYTTRRIVTAAWVLVTGATVVGFALHGPYAAGLGIRDALDPALWRNVAGTRFGAVWLGRLVLLAIAFGLLRWWFRAHPADDPRVPRWWLVLATIVGLGIVATPALAGHSDSGDYRLLAQLTSTVHVGAMSVWLGGLVMLGAVAMRDPDIDDARAGVTRFSRIATGCVLAVIVSGIFQSSRQVRDLGGLRDTDFGHVLVIKLFVFAGMVLVAAFSRDFVNRLFGRRLVEPAVPVVAGGSVDTDPESDGRTAGELATERQREWRNLRRSVWAEALLGIMVLAVTAVLVNTAPAVSASRAAEGAAGVTMRSPRVVVDVTASPAVAGRNDLHVSTFSAAGAPLDVVELTVTLDLPSKRIAPITVPLRDLGPGHYLSPGFTIPFPGEWRVNAKVLLSDVDLVPLSGSIAIR